MSRSRDKANEYYTKLLTIKTKQTKSNYSQDYEITHTLKNIKLVYNHLNKYFTDQDKPKRGGGPSNIVTIFTM